MDSPPVPTCRPHQAGRSLSPLLKALVCSVQRRRCSNFVTHVVCKPRNGPYNFPTNPTKVRVQTLDGLLFVSQPSPQFLAFNSLHSQSRLPLSRMGAPKNLIAESIFASVTPTLCQSQKGTGLNDGDGKILVQANFSWSPLIESSRDTGKDYTVLPLDVIITPALPTGLINHEAEQR